MFVISMLPQYNTVQYSPREKPDSMFYVLLRSNTKDIIILPTEWINGLSSTLYELSRRGILLSLKRKTLLRPRDLRRITGVAERF